MKVLLSVCYSIPFLFAVFLYSNELTLPINKNLSEAQNSTYTSALEILSGSTINPLPTSFQTAQIHIEQLSVMQSTAPTSSEVVDLAAFLLVFNDVKKGKFTDSIYSLVNKIKMKEVEIEGVKNNNNATITISLQRKGEIPKKVTAPLTWGNIYLALTGTLPPEDVLFTHLRLSH